MNENEWEEVKAGNFWNPEKEGETIEGVIISMEEGQFGKEITIEQNDKKMITLPNHAVLQSRMKNCKIGDVVKIVFEKIELPKIKGHKPTNIYKVLRKAAQN